MRLQQLNETPGMGDKQQWDFKEFKKEPETVDYKTISNHYKTIFISPLPENPVLQGGDAEARNHFI